MKKLLIASIAALAISATPAFSQIIKDDSEAAGATVGGATGGTAGAVVGGLIFGPIGAAIGGFTGAVIGAEAGVDASTVDYVRVNPVEPVVIDGTIDAGFVVPETVTIYPVEGNPSYGYFYTEDRAWIVDMSNRTVVYSPGTVVAVEAN